MAAKSLGLVAIEQLEGNSDEQLFAGLLLLTKCSKDELEALSSKAITLLLKNKTLKSSNGGGFLHRLLITMPSEDNLESDNDETNESTMHFKFLSQMQSVGLHVTSTLALCCSDQESKSALAKSLSPALLQLLDLLIDKDASKTYKIGSLKEDIYSVLDCLRNLLISDKINSKSFWPSNMIELLCKLINTNPQLSQTSKLTSSCLNEEDLENIASNEKTESSSDEPTSAGGGNDFWYQLSTVIHELMRFRLQGNTVSEQELLCVIKLIDSDANISGKGKKPNKEKSASENLNSQEKDTESNSGETVNYQRSKESMVSLVLDYILLWTRSQLENPLNLELRMKLEAGEFSKWLRRCVVIGLHGGASEHVRDTCMQVIMLSSMVIGGDWLLEDTSTSSTTPLGSTACLFLKVSGCEIRLLVDEALALYASSSSSEAGGDEGGTPRGGLSKEQSFIRKQRCLNMLPVSLKIVEHMIQSLCSYEDEDEEEVESSNKWGGLASDCLLEIKQSLDGIAKTIIEFLNDASKSPILLATYQNSSVSSNNDDSSPPSLVDYDETAEEEDQETNQRNQSELINMCLECGRCLACWVANDTESLRSDLTNSNTFKFLLKFSKYSSEQVIDTSMEAKTTRATSSNSIDVSSKETSSANFEDGDSVDSDDELSPASTPASTPAVPAAAIQGNTEPVVDIFCALLPALVSLVGDEGGAHSLVEMSVHEQCCHFIQHMHSQHSKTMSSPTLDADLIRSFPTTTTTQSFTFLVWALDLLSSMLSVVGSGYIVSLDGYNGTLKEQPCFVTIKPCLTYFSRASHAETSSRFSAELVKDILPSVEREAKGLLELL